MPSVFLWSWKCFGEAAICDDLRSRQRSTFTSAIRAGLSWWNWNGAVFVEGRNMKPEQWSKPRVGWGIQGIILSSYIGIMIGYMTFCGALDDFLTMTPWPGLTLFFLYSLARMITRSQSFVAEHPQHGLSRCQSRLSRWCHPLLPFWMA